MKRSLESMWLWLAYILVSGVFVAAVWGLIAFTKFIAA